MRQLTRTIATVAAATAAFTLTACSGGDSSTSSDLDDALCADLDSGMGLHQIRPDDMPPEEFAEHVNSAVSNACPSYEGDVSVSYFLENWGYR